MGTNLPPGVTAADIDRHFGGGHAHEFRDPQPREGFEDGAFMCITQCEHRTDTNARHNHGCEAEKHVRLDASSVSVQQRSGEWHTIAESDTNVFHDTIDGDTALSVEDVERIESAIAEAICDGAVVMSHDRAGVTVGCHRQSRVVSIDADAFNRLPDQDIRVTYDNASEEIRQ